MIKVKGKKFKEGKKFKCVFDPCIEGCIDGTRVRIMRPSGEGVEKCFINRKMFPSINVQAVCDHKGNFHQ